MATLPASIAALSTSHSALPSGVTAQNEQASIECSTVPIWKGEPLEGKTILLYSEQGFGDEILCLRFAKPIKAMGARVIVSVRAPIFRLAHSLDFVDAVITQYGPEAYERVELLQYDCPPWKLDYISALLAVPTFIEAGLKCRWTDEDRFPLPVGMDAETLPCRGRYIDAWPCRYELPSDGINVGICWATGKNNKYPTYAARKTLELWRFAPLARPGVNLISLQHVHDDADVLGALGVIDLMAEVADFADTASIIDRLDLVVTVDTAVAHIAGALGKPVWNLVVHDAYWPWLFETDATCWYDSMRLYRQWEDSNWDDPLGGLFADFDLLCGPAPRRPERGVDF